MTTKTGPATTLSGFIREVENVGDVVPFIPDMSYDDPPTFETGVVLPLKREVYDYFLELLPPRFMNRWCFAFGEGAGTLRLFWEDNGDFYGTQLTDEQTEQFCRIVGIRRDNS